MHPNVTFPDGRTVPVNPGPFHSGHMPTSPLVSVVVPLYVPVGPTGPHQHIQTADEIQALLDGEFGVLTFTSDQWNPYYWIASPDDARRLAARYGIGQKVGARAWVFTDDDIERLREISTGKAGRPIRDVPAE